MDQVERKSPRERPIIIAGAAFLYLAAEVWAGLADAASAANLAATFVAQADALVDFVAYCVLA